MDRDEVLAEFDRQMRREAVSDDLGARMERTERLVRQVGGTAHTWAGVLWSGLDDGTADEAIAAQTAWLAGPEGRGREFEWKLYSHDRPADLGDRLRRAGFVPDPTETLMIAEVAALPTEVRLPDGVRLEPVTDAAGVDLVAAVHERAFGASAARLRDRLLDQLAQTADGSLTMTVAMAGDEPVCAARMEITPGTDFAGLWGGGTVEEWRGRGIYRALVAHRAALAAARGIRYLQVDATDDSRPILQRLGFAALSTTTPYLIQG
ncbi:GNAT family N-acetyltransferase [Actinacidiphila acidipaludis]|uniref:GNAT family N-acetyltransferase n=1 Tax=Actinacidiphila acidipaludis TaxID=2873382 RepID=A0ABS7QG69_9ACTN|nr:GNAT family N-acetyltransferase [Streptomyces acidipaludis]MBY8881806.1 GNAT family N-acetyltransferase [Streptomyces acidipaludis]